MLNHSCDPNCRVYWARPGDRFVLETRRPVARGEELTITYCCPSLGTPARQAKLLATKGFRCGCGRCRDPGERGTWLGGVVCTRCRGPALAPAWQPGCGGSTSSASIRSWSRGPA